MNHIFITYPTAPLQAQYHLPANLEWVTITTNADGSWTCVGVDVYGGLHTYES